MTVFVLNAIDSGWSTHISHISYFCPTQRLNSHEWDKWNDNDKSAAHFTWVWFLSTCFCKHQAQHNHLKPLSPYNITSCKIGIVFNGKTMYYNKIKLSFGMVYSQNRVSLLHSFSHSQFKTCREHTLLYSTVEAIAILYLHIAFISSLAVARTHVRTRTHTHARTLHLFTCMHACTHTRCATMCATHAHTHTQWVSPCRCCFVRC